MSEPLKTYEDLKQECAPIAYKEIEQFFARGMIILVANNTDLLDVALVIQDNDTEKLEKLIKQNKVIRAHDDHAIKWNKNNPQLMAVTAVPWLLIQEI